MVARPAQPSPFRPGFAAAPPVLAGREELLRMVETLTSSGVRRHESFAVLYGPRGVGKTVLLDRFAEIAGRRQWVVVDHEVTPDNDLLQAIVHQLRDNDRLPRRIQAEVRELADRWSEQTQKIKLGVYERELRRAAEPATSLARRLVDIVGRVCRAATDDRRGLMLLIDEAHAASAGELWPFGPMLQELSRSPELSALIVFAGLPSLPGNIVDAFTYGERLWMHELGNLSKAATAHALAQPARDAGKAFAPGALEALVADTGGYPYFVQLLGDHVWKVAGDAPSITVDHVAAGVAEGRAVAAASLFRARWTRLHMAEREYVTTMAAIATAGPVATSAIADALHRPLGSLSRVRAQLIDKGVIVSLRRGFVEETIPGFLAYVRETTEA